VTLTDWADYDRFWCKAFVDAYVWTLTPADFAEMMRSPWPLWMGDPTLEIAYWW